MAKGKKTGGRKKGSRNKDKIPAQQMAEDLGIDPFKVLLYFTDGDNKALGLEPGEITPAMRLAAASEACDYILPKRKAIEGDVNVDMTSFTDIVKSLIDDLG